MFRVGPEAQTIRSHGLCVQVDPGPRLVAELRTNDKIHLCQSLSSPDLRRGMRHAQEYGVLGKPHGVG